ncbi:A/G-specific adenine glycosylase [Planktothrix mougeotii]|uniref:Adenine DNA glycosylase n=1 Tax=Planktothrix mougeotii LEGE 06226 TaxID=1828728 RepID=A0ABR9U5P2_9CYAN|nr:A/G-specific adenine glycosylase [Planktothrix mougeotii]MBE9141771.1 A/G-specific adenine glycosylase [Planktothrix mougeotii LEGE 06226]
MSLPEFDVIQLRRSLLSWYAQTGRNLPWRNSADPYKIWISEIMLQQTQVKTVIPYYQRWLETFPTVQDLAEADLQAVLKVWQGLGYYARARNLHACAQQIVQQYDGVFPNQLEAALSLPGIGRTTAGGVLSAAYNLPVSILDGNVKRVLARLRALSVPPGKALKSLWEWSDSLLDPDHPREFNQAIMDLGAMVCTPKAPNCSECPWQGHCQAYLLNLQSEIPMREISAPLPHKMIGVAVIWNEQNQILIDKRPAKGLLGGLWEFPGGKLEAGETLEECIKREIQEELAIEIEVQDHLITIEHAYTHFKVTLNVYHCRYMSGEPQPLECDEIRWVTLDEIEQFPFPKANEKIIAALKSNS